MPRSVVVAGPSQCGSTRVFNAARIIGEIAGHSVHAHWGIHKTPPAGADCAIDIAKVHAEHSGAELRRYFHTILLPVRDPRDAALSARARKTAQCKVATTSLPKFCAAFARIFETLLPHATLVVPYEGFGGREVQRIARAMRVPLTNAQVRKVLRRLTRLYHSSTLPAHDDRTSTQFRRTLLSRSHNTSNGRSEKWRTEMTAAERRRTLAAPGVRRFLRAHGYAER